MLASPVLLALAAPLLLLSAAPVLPALVLPAPVPSVALLVGTGPLSVTPPSVAAVVAGSPLVGTPVCPVSAAIPVALTSDAWLSDAAEPPQDFDIREVVRTIVTSPEFFSRAAYRAKVKSPFEVVVSTARALGAAPDTTAISALAVARLGAPIFGHQAPNGWPETGEAWMNTGAILSRINFGLTVAANRVPGARVTAWPSYATLRTAPRAQQVDGVIDALSRYLRGLSAVAQGALLPRRAAADDAQNLAACRQIPHHRCPIRGRRHQPFAVGIRRTRADRIGVADQRALHLTRNGIPQLNRLVFRRRHQQRSTVDQEARHDRADMAIRTAAVVRRTQIPQLQRLVFRRRNQLPPVVGQRA